MPDTVSPSTCCDCGLLNCYREDKRYPEFCLTEQMDAGQLADAVELYRGDEVDGTLARAAADIEGIYYGKLTRAEETIAFAHRIGVRKVGVATCVGLIEESRLFAKMLKLADLEPFAVLCKVGAVDKSEIGVPDERKIRPGSRESCCNPIMQARLLNGYETDLNVIVGLCVGHDSLFIRHSKAPVTTLIVKDRVLAHNPASAFHLVKTYYSRLLDEEHLRRLGRV